MVGSGGNASGSARGGAVRAGGVEAVQDGSGHDVGESASIGELEVAEVGWRGRRRSRADVFERDEECVGEEGDGGGGGFGKGEADSARCSVSVENSPIAARTGVVDGVADTSGELAGGATKKVVDTRLLPPSGVDAL